MPELEVKGEVAADAVRVPSEQVFLWSMMLRSIKLYAENQIYPEYYTRIVFSEIADSAGRYLRPVTRWCPISDHDERVFDLDEFEGFVDLMSRYADFYDTYRYDFVDGQLKVSQFIDSALFFLGTWQRVVV